MSSPADSCCGRAPPEESQTELSLSEESLRPEDHDENEADGQDDIGDAVESAELERPELAAIFDGSQQLGHHGHDDGSHNRAGDAAHTAQDNHDDHGKRRREVETTRRDGPDLVSQERSRDPVKKALTTKASSRERKTLIPTPRDAIRFSREAIIARPYGELRRRSAM